MKNVKNSVKRKQFRKTKKFSEYEKKTNKNAAPVRRLLIGLEKPKFLAQNCAKNVTENIGSLI